MDVIVFGMENCPGCVTVKRILKDHGIEFCEMDVMNPEHMAEAQYYGVRGVPSVVRVYQSNFGMVTGSRPQDIANILSMVGVE